MARFGVAQLKIASITWPSESDEEKSTLAIQAEAAIANAEKQVRDGDVDGAVDMLDKAVLDGAVPDALRGRLVYVRARINRKSSRFNAALVDYRAMYSMPGLSSRLRQSGLFDSCTAYLLSENWSNAVERYTAFLADYREPADRAMALVNRAAAYRELGDDDSSMTDLTEVIDGVDMPPDQRAKARVWRAQSYVDFGNYPAAIKEITPILRDGADPAELADAHALHGMALANLGHADEAARAYERALSDAGRPQQVADGVQHLLKELREQN